MTPYGVGEGNSLLRIDIAGFQAGSQIVQRMSAPLPEIGPSSVGSPHTIDGFNCLGVNVVGPGIAPASGHGDPAQVLARIYSGDTCTYPGVTSKPISLTSGTSAVELSVPSGTARVVQVLGIRDPRGLYCGRDKTIAEVDSANQDLDFVPFEVGRAILDITQTSAVGISNEYRDKSYRQRGDRVVACGGNAQETQGKVPFNLGTHGLVGWWAADSLELAHPEPGAGVTLNSGTTWRSERSSLGLDLSGTAETTSLKYRRLDIGQTENRNLYFNTATASLGAFSASQASGFGTSMAGTLVVFGKFTNASGTSMMKVESSAGGQSYFELRKYASAQLSFDVRADGNPSYLVMNYNDNIRSVMVGRVELTGSNVVLNTTCMYIDGTRCSPVQDSQSNPGIFNFSGTTTYKVGTTTIAGDDLTEVMVFNRKLSDSEVERLFNYFRLRYGIPYVN